MTQSSPQPTQKFRGKLTRTTLLLVLPLIIISFALFGIINRYNLSQTAIIPEAPETGISESFLGSIQSEITLLAIIIFVLGIIIWLATRRIVRPIEEISASAMAFADGDMHARAVVNRNDEIGLLAYSFNYVADQVATRNISMEKTIESRTRQLQVASEVAQIVTSTVSLEEILSKTVNLITERFNYYHAAIFLMDRGGDNLVLREAAGEASHQQLESWLYREVGSRSIVGNVAATNQPRIADDVKHDHYYVEFESLSGTQSEVAIPLSIGGRVLGVLDVHSNELKAFDDQDVATLQILARQIASAIQNVHSLENTNIDLLSANLLYQTSHRLAAAETIQSCFLILAEILQQVPFITQIFSLKSGKLQRVEITSNANSKHVSDVVISLTKDHINKILTELSWKVVQTDVLPSGLPENLSGLVNEIGCREFVLIPLTLSGQLTGLIILGSVTENDLNPSSLDLFNSIAEMLNTTLAKIEASHRITASFTELQSLSTLSQAISTETNLDNLFEILHHQIVQTMGDVNFLIALYDTATQLIEIPYMTEGDQIVSIPNFPLGQGLTSIVIRTQQPLMIVEDTINRTRSLGAIVTSGKAAQSWLGVPLMVAGEIVGALAVQDLEHEHRFDEDDLRLLTSLAAQVAPTIRNARLLAVTQEAAERDRQLFEITSNIRQATSIPEILELTTRELSKALNLNKAKIEINTDSTYINNRDNGTEEKTA